ncbi:Signal transduction histidine kinase CheA [Labilithrix luteola]|uniref:histidine kinase n=1 Tax=Labilithrix luteola TaxID=1391654 RepID=A0A0K1PWQ0_9BACT|nr:Signal transduction histidine kinase CheA [Labilithrix luteola]
MFARVDVHEAIRHILAISRSEIERRQVVVQLALNAEPPIVFGDGVQLQQVILNLVVNAIDAMSDIHDRARELKVVTRVVDGTALEVSVRDSGIGIRRDLVQKIFQPFYTTKANGMGMGLAISNSIVKAHKGELHAATLLPYGSQFSFTIPLPDHATP